jgi:hypothetical protein
MAYHHHLWWVFLAAGHHLCWQRVARHFDSAVREALLSSKCPEAVIASVRPASSLLLPVRILSVQLHPARRHTPVGPISIRNSSIEWVQLWRRVCLLTDTSR